MALSIVLTVKGKIPEWNENKSISFEDSAEYWYLYDSMINEIKKQTGKLIDLYDDATFAGDNLNKVEKLIVKEIQELSQKNEKKWEVHTGTQLHPAKKEIYKTLIKKELQLKLEKFLTVIQEAIEKNEKVICIGD